MTDLDIRLDVRGLHIANKEQISDEIDLTLSEFASALTLACNTKETYRLFKDIRKQLKDEKNAIWSSIKEKVSSFTEEILDDRKKLCEKYDELYDIVDAAIKAYEEENEVGAAKAKLTREANKLAKQETISSLMLTLQCPSEEVKNRITQYAIDLGAIIL